MMVKKLQIVSVTAVTVLIFLFKSSAAQYGAPQLQRQQGPGPAMGLYGQPQQGYTYMQPTPSRPPVPIQPQPGYNFQQQQPAAPSFPPSVQPQQAYTYQQPASVPSIIPSVQPQQLPTYNNYEPPPPNLFPETPSSKLTCQKQLVDNELRFICSGPTPKFHTKYILWLDSSSLVRNPPIRIEIPNYKIDDWIQAGVKSTQNIQKSVINVLVKKPEVTYQAAAQVPPPSSGTGDAEVHLEYEPIQDKQVHFPNDGRLELLPPGSIQEPGGSPGIDIRQNFRRSPPPQAAAMATSPFQGRDAYVRQQPQKQAVLGRVW